MLFAQDRSFRRLGFVSMTFSFTGSTSDMLVAYLLCFDFESFDFFII